MSADASQHDPLTLHEFEPTSYDQWRAEAERALKGAPFDKKLISRTPEGIEIHPIYGPWDDRSQKEALPGFSSRLRGGNAAGYLGAPWLISQSAPLGSAKDFNAATRHDVERGQTAVRLSLDRAGRYGRDPDLAGPGDVGFCGASIATAQDLAKAIQGLETLPLQLQPGSSGLPLLALLAPALEKAGVDLATVRGALEQDPIGELLIDGSLPQTLEASLDQMADVTRWTLRRMPHLATIAVRANAYSDAGGTAVHELAFAIGTGVTYLREMTKRGLKLDDVAQRICFHFSIGGDFFMAIAKFRAARVLWQRVVEASGGNAASQKLRLHARTALWNKTVHDPYVNMLRNTAEACAAVFGGCESLEVGAFDEVVRPPDEFSRRIARNIQIILREECQFDRVIDPAGGSWHVEWLTEQLAQKAWSQFQEVEKRGGMIEALRSAYPQDEVDRAHAARAKSVAQRRTSLVGTNVYANPAEKPLETREWKLDELQRKRASEIAHYRTEGGHAFQTALLEKLGRMLDGGDGQMVELAIEAAAHGATLGELWRTLPRRVDNDTVIRPLPLRRGAERFEKLRAAVSTSGRGSVFLANMGPLRQHKLRADFARSFFQAGGFEMLDTPGFPDADAAADAALNSDAPVVVICSTDDTYPELVPTIAESIKSRDAERVVVLAGFPEAHIEAFRKAGVDEFIHIRANCHETLSRIANRIGIQS